MQPTNNTCKCVSKREVNMPANGIVDMKSESFFRFCCFMHLRKFPP